jgi:hypothetical protein
MAKTIQEALAEVQRRLDELVIPIDANRATRQVPRPAGAPMPASGSTTSAAPAPAPRPAPRPAAAASAPAGPSNSDIYAKHGVGGSDESTGAFARAESDIAARNKAAPTAPAAAAKPAPAARQTQAPRPATTGNPDVLKQQKALISQGAKIKADGIMGPQTRAAQAAQDKTDSMKMGRAGVMGARADTTDDTVNKMTQNYNNRPDSTTSTIERMGTSSPGAPAPGVDPNDTRESPRPAPAASENQETQRRLDPDVTETESGPSKGKKKMSESALINAFMKLQQTKAGNIFEAAKKMKTRYEGGADDKTSWTDDEVKHNNSPEGLDTYAKQIQKAGDEQYQRNKSMEPGDVGKGIDNDIMQKRGLSKANSMSNQSSSASGPGASASSSGSASASTHNIQFADKPGQTFKAIGPDPDAKKGSGPESYFKKGSTNTAEKPSEDEIDRRMRVALGHSKGPEDYFKSTPKKDDTSGTGTSMTNQSEYLKPSGPKTSVGKADERKSTTKDNDEYETDIYGRNSEGKSGGPGTVRNYKGPMTSQDNFDSMSSETGKRPNLRYGYKTGQKATNEAFLNLLEKKAKKDYDGDGKVESEKDEVWGSRFKAAKKAGKMEEELKGNQSKIDANNNGKIDGDDFRKLRSGKKAEKMKAYRADRDKHGEMEEEVEQIDERDMGNKAKKDAAVAGVGAKNRDEKHLGSRGMKTSVADKIRGREVTSGKDRMEEEVDPGFSEAELAHFEAVINRKDQKGKERAMGDTVASEDLTDEYINEMARKPGETRGRKAGTKVQGGYKNTKSKRGGDDAKGGAVEADEPKGVPHVLDQIRHGREDEHGFKTITHPASSPEAPVTKKIHRSDLHGFYDKYHNTEKPAAKEKEYSGFLDKHFGDSRTSSPTSQSFSTDLSKVEKSNLKGGAGKVSLGGSSRVGGSKKEW